MSIRNGHGTMSSELDPHADPGRPTVFRIRGGQLDDRWADRFAGTPITFNGEDTLITGPVVHQAALHGLLERVRDLGPAVRRPEARLGERR